MSVGERSRVKVPLAADDDREDLSVVKTDMCTDSQEDKDKQTSSP